MGRDRKPLTLRGAVPLAHFFLMERVAAGDLALDATCGNGNDTVLLAQLVGESGRVWGFDVQPAAIAATRELLERHGLHHRVQLVQAGHETLSGLVPAGLKAAVFNLGYLPGGESSVITGAASTVSALDQAAELLLPGGIILVCIYTGHPGGEGEACAVEEWCANLSPKKFNTWVSRQLNRPPVAPYLVLAERV